MKLILIILAVIGIGVGLILGLIAFALKIGELMIRGAERKKMKKEYQGKVVYMSNFISDDKQGKLGGKLKRLFSRKR